MQQGKKFLSDLKLHSDYLKWIESESRYETWEEACDSIMNGHKEKYADLLKSNIKFRTYIDSAVISMKEKQVLASQRNLQYRPEQVKRNNARLYNCSSMYGARNKVFQEVFYLALSGCGVGIGLLIPFVNNLSRIEKRTKGTKTFIIPDSIEGWADALGVLMSSFFVDKQPFPEYAGYEIKFDYSQIRPQGSFISGGFKAPGPKGLEQSLNKIEELLNNWIVKEGNKLRPIAVCDIMCHASDAVLSGGVRRSALNMIVDPNDEEMIMAKTGNWRTEFPHRGRTNNSVLLIRDNITKEQFEKIVNLNEGTSDIGFAFANSWFDMFNPCFTGDMEILTPSGYKRFDSFNDGEHIKLINAVGQEVNGYIKQTGYKDVVDVTLTTGKTIRCTPDHLLIDIDGNEIEAQDSKGIQLAHYLNHNSVFEDEYVKYGFLQGDSVLSRLSSTTHKGLEVCFNPKDNEVADLFEIECNTKTYITGYNDKLRELGFSQETLPTRVLPNTFNDWDITKKKSFLRGLFSANGSMLKAGRVTLKSTCKELIESLVKIFTDLGVNVYYTINKEKPTEFKNGAYTCKESYDLNFASYDSLVWFYNNIGFIQSYKTAILLDTLKIKAPKVRSIKSLKNKEVVYDFELDDLIHCGVVNGLVVHNCFEILKHPILYSGEKKLNEFKYEEIEAFIKENENNLGVAFCNLCEINAENIKSELEFLYACESAAIIGTLQASYTNFPYLGKVTEEIVRKEALIGVSITGWMNNPMLFNPELLKKGANTVKDINKEIAEMIGINPAARTTCVKPSGNASVILGTASGIHPEHSEKYFRVMQLNKENDTAKWLAKNMPFLLEESIWSTTNTDYCVFVPIENPKDGLFKKDMKGVKHLELIKLVQLNWVNEGTNKELCQYPQCNHNTSNTVIIDDKEEVINYIWENRKDFTAVSFISDYGDKEFIQAPFTSVSNMDEIIETYGEGALFISGLIVDGLHQFNDNLWIACDMANNRDIPVTGTREQVMLRKYWLSRVKKFAKNFFDGDLQKTIYCMKDVHLLHKWKVINRQFKPVDFGLILNKPTYKNVSEFAAQACSGSGSCEITRI